VGAAAAIYGARFLLECDASQHSELVRKIGYNLRQRVVRYEEDTDHYRFLASHVSHLLLQLAGAAADEHSVRVAYEISNSAIKLGDGAAPELVSSAGEAALRLGKYALKRGNEASALDMFVEAGELFENGIVLAIASGSSETFSLKIAHSKAGEAFTRAHTFSGSDVHAQKAVSHLTSSQELCNEAPQLIGFRAKASEAYAASVLFRVAFSLARIRTRAGRMPSAAVRAGERRVAHYYSLLDYLSNFEEKRIAKLAAALQQSELGTSG